MLLLFLLSEIVIIVFSSCSVVTRWSFWYYLELEKMSTTLTFLPAQNQVRSVVPSWLDLKMP